MRARVRAEDRTNAKRPARLQALAYIRIYALCTKRREEIPDEITGFEQHVEKHARIVRLSFEIVR